MDVAAEFAQEPLVSEALAQFKATLQAAVREVQVDVRAFKQRIEQKIEELCISNGPLAGAVTRLEEENLQLRTKLDALSCLVEGLAGVKMENPAEVKGRNLPDYAGNGQIEPKIREVVHRGGSESSQPTNSDPSGSRGGSGCAPAVAAPNSRAPPPWRARRHAEVNVSALLIAPHRIATKLGVFVCSRANVWANEVQAVKSRWGDGARAMVTIQ